MHMYQNPNIHIMLLYGKRTLVHHCNQFINLLAIRFSSEEQMARNHTSISDSHKLFLLLTIPLIKSKQRYRPKKQKSNIDKSNKRAVYQPNSVIYCLIFPNQAQPVKWATDGMSQSILGADCHFDWSMGQWILCLGLQGSRIISNHVIL